MSNLVKPGQFIQYPSGIVNRVVDTETYPFRDPDITSVTEAAYSLRHGMAAVITNGDLYMQAEDLDRLNLFAAMLIMKWGYNAAGLKWELTSGEYLNGAMKIPCREFQPILKMNNAMELVGVLLNEGFLYNLSAVVENGEVVHVATFTESESCESFTAKAVTPQLAITLAAILVVGLRIIFSDEWFTCTEKPDGNAFAAGHLYRGSTNPLTQTATIVGRDGKLYDFRHGQWKEYFKSIPHAEVKIDIGSILKFPTGYVCRVVPDNEAELYCEIDKLGLNDALYYVENGGCQIVPAEQYVEPGGSLRMEIVTSSLRGCMRHMEGRAVAICNESPDVQVIIDKKEKLQLLTGEPFDETAYEGRTWTKKALPFGN